MKKYLILGLISILSLSCLTGCLKRDIMEDINIATTIYPIEYVTNRLYGQNNKVESIYPRGANPATYKISKKQLRDFSDYDLFIYNGKSDEKEYATEMLDNNKKLKIIDAAYDLSVTYSSSDIWLNPSNILMISKNIKDELEELIVSKTVIKEIDNNYEQLKLDITVLETELKKTADSSINNTIVTGDESLEFLEKYGFNVINLTKNGKEVASNVQKATELIKNNKINYIFIMEHSNNYDIIDVLKNNYNLKLLTFNSMDNIDDQDEKDNNDYISLMNNNINLLKEETYK